ncbi:MAG: type II secretion system protein GspC [Myxococcota bacterium]
MNRKLIGTVLTLTFVPWTLGFATTKYLEWSVALTSDQEITEMEAVDAPQEEGRRKNKSTKSTSTLSEDSYVRSIINRSIFDSSKVNEKLTTKPDINPEDGVLSDLEATLLGTVVAVPPEYSVALIKDNKSNASSPYALGDNLLNEAQIIGIEQKRVLLKRSNGTIEYIELGDKESEKGSRTKGKSGADGEEDSGVTKEGPNKYIVDQAVLDQLLENPEQLASQVRVIPHKDEGGQIDGYRLSGIRRNSIFYKLGVKNGDIIHNVNGMPLNSMSSAMDAYNSLGSSKNFSFEITRRRQKQNFDYEVR